MAQVIFVLVVLGTAIWELVTVERMCAQLSEKLNEVIDQTNQHSEQIITLKDKINEIIEEINKIQ